jgi:hypothetical protein
MRRQSDLAIGERVEDSPDHIREACHRASDGPLSINLPRARARAQKNALPKVFERLRKIPTTEIASLSSYLLAQTFEHEHEHERRTVNGEP